MASLLGGHLFFCQIAQAGKYVSSRQVILLRHIRGMMGGTYGHSSPSVILQIINLIIGKTKAVVDKLSHAADLPKTEDIRLRVGSHARAVSSISHHYHTNRLSISVRVSISVSFGLLITIIIYSRIETNTRGCGKIFSKGVKHVPARQRISVENGSFPHQGRSLSVLRGDAL